MFQILWKLIGFLITETYLREQSFKFRFDLIQQHFVYNFKAERSHTQTIILNLVKQKG
jgi:hypothetical protein